MREKCVKCLFGVELGRGRSESWGGVNCIARREYTFEIRGGVGRMELVMSRFISWF